MTDEMQRGRPLFLEGRRLTAELLNEERRSRNERLQEHASVDHGPTDDVPPSDLRAGTIHSADGTLRVVLEDNTIAPKDAVRVQAGPAGDSIDLLTVTREQATITGDLAVSEDLMIRPSTQHAAVRDARRYLVFPRPRTPAPKPSPWSIQRVRQSSKGRPEVDDDELRLEMFHPQAEGGADRNRTVIGRRSSTDGSFVPLISIDAAGDFICHDVPVDSGGREEQSDKPSFRTGGVVYEGPIRSDFRDPRMRVKFRDAWRTGVALGLESVLPASLLNVEFKIEDKSTFRPTISNPTEDAVTVSSVVITEADGQPRFALAKRDGAQDSERDLNIEIPAGGRLRPDAAFSIGSNSEFQFRENVDYLCTVVGPDVIGHSNPTRRSS